jgi:hypothetical protein
MNVFFIPSAIAGAALYALLFLPHDLGMVEFHHPVENNEVIDEYIELLEERNQLMRELIELEQLRQKIETGKAWSA